MFVFGFYSHTGMHVELSSEGKVEHPLIWGCLAQVFLVGNYKVTRLSSRNQYSYKVIAVK